MISVPLIERETLLRARRERLLADARSAARARICFPPTHASPWPMYAAAMCASGARSPLAPTEPLRGTTGTKPLLKRRTSASTSSTRTPECPRSEPVQAQHLRDAHLLARHRLADAAAVREHQVLLQLLEVRARDRDVLQLAEARRQPVDDVAGARRALDELARARATAASRAGASARLTGAPREDGRAGRRG